MSELRPMAQPDQFHLKTSMRKVALTALAGTSIEWYDFFLYATAAALVFPSDTENVIFIYFETGEKSNQ